MRLSRLVPVFLLAAPFAFGASKEIQELQRDVAMLQDQVRTMQKDFGDRRATAAKDLLVQLGVAADRLKTISYGKERPQCTDATEDCWQKNRRAHLSPGQ